MNRSLLVFAAILVAGCASAPPAVTTEPNDSTPVILVPGMIGTKLVVPGSERVVWGSTTAAFFPRDGGYSMAMPLPGADQAEPTAYATDVLLRMRLFGLFSYDAYRPIVELMEANGYRTGDLRNPTPKDTFFLFGYDWRLTSPDAAGEMMKALERLRRARGEDTLRVHLVCQSTANRICRFLLKYGAATLEEAEQGEEARPFSLKVDRLVLIGSANGGSLRTLREIHRGRHYAGMFGRRFLPEVLFSFRGLYEDLPLTDDMIFTDEAGDRIELDPFDVRVWQEYQWSVFSPTTAARIESRTPDWMPNEDLRVRYLDGFLDRARRLNELLISDSPAFSDETTFFMIQSDTTPTPRQARIEREGDQWTLVFGGDKGATGGEWETAGDGHATVASQNHLSPQEIERLDGPTFKVDGAHFHMILDPAAQRRLIEVLSD